MYLISKAQALLANAKQWVRIIFEGTFNHFQHRGVSLFEETIQKEIFSEKYFGFFCFNFLLQWLLSEEYYDFLVRHYSYKKFNKHVDLELLFV